MRALRVYACSIIAGLVAALIAIPAAGASSPQPQHFRFGPFVNTDDNFCGTGKTVTDTFTAHMNVWLDPNQPVDSRNQSVSEEVLTSPSTGVTVVSHSAYSFSDMLVAGDPSGVNTHRWTFKGGAQITRVVGGGVIIRDAGNFVVEATWSGPEFDSELIGIEVIRDAGGHPDFASDFCAAMVPALGLG